MRVHIVAAFPQVVQAYFAHSIPASAIASGALTVVSHDLSNYSTRPEHRIDDRPYGGGAGMLLQVEPIHRSITAILSQYSDSSSLRFIFTSPAGTPFTQSIASDISANTSDIIMLCGHYEGVDARVFELYPQFEAYSVGAYVLSGGELAACTMLDAIARLLPGVLSPASLDTETHNQPGVGEYPQYTRPAVYEGLFVPEELTSGNHPLIAQWQQAHRTSLG
jgi:tRNA (guanine37-N1)-methyltransferase